MSETALIKNPEASLIKNGPTENIVKKLNGLKANNLYERQTQEVKPKKKPSIEDFKTLCWNFFEATYGQTETLARASSREEMVALINKFARMSKKRAIFQKAVTVIVPVIGQLAGLIGFYVFEGDGGFVSWRYISYLKKLKAGNGENVLSEDGWKNLKNEL